MTLPTIEQLSAPLDAGYVAGKLEKLMTQLAAETLKPRSHRRKPCASFQARVLCRVARIES